MNMFKSIFKIPARSEILAQSLLFLILFVFLLPFLSGQGGLCYDDAAFISFPRLIAVARAFQNGEFPIWDSNEYSGAKPFYTMMESPAYNIILYPLFFMADADNLDQSFFILYILPFIFMTMFAGFGSYFFFRKVLKSNEWISLVCGIAYALNPSIALSNLSLINTFVFAYIPWILMSIAKYLETRKFRWWLSAVFIFVLLNTSYNLNYTFRIYFFISLITLILSIQCYIQNRKNLKYILYTLGVFITAIGLTAFVWSGIIEGLSWVAEDVGSKFAESINDLTNSVQPGHLITLFIPGFNGTLDNAHTWGDGFLVHSPDTVLQGGVFTTLLIIVSFILLFNDKKYKLDIGGNLKIWLIIGLSVDIFALLIMLGRYSPFFYIMAKVLPWFFAIPYPFYYHFAQHLGTIIAAGAALTILDKIKGNVFQNESGSRRTISLIINYRKVFIYLGFIVLFIAAYLYMPVYYPDFFVKRNFKNIDVLAFYRDWLWFLTIPVSYFVLISLLLITGIGFIKRKINIFLLILASGVLIESLFIGFPMFYFNQNMPRAYSLNDWQYFRSGARHPSLPSEYDYFSRISGLKEKLDKTSSRFTSDLSVFENHAWLTDTRSFTGYEAKPVMKKMSGIVMELYDHWPYEMWAYLFPKYLLSNMNVGYILNCNHRLGGNEIYDYRKEGEEDKPFYSLRPPDSIKIITEKNYHTYFKDPFYRIHEIEKPMPYIYFQDKIFTAEEDEQKERLLFTDLRKGALVSSNGPCSFLTENGPIEQTGNSREEFERLQFETDRITQYDMKRHNKLKIKAFVTKPALLIRCEAYHPGWKVYINDSKAELIRVNYLQQGVYINKTGECEIVFKFMPLSLIAGLLISAVFLLLTAVIIIIIIINLKIGKRKASHDQ